MESALTFNQIDFAEDFLTRLRKIFNSLEPLKIRETERDGIRYFSMKFLKLCLYNRYAGGVQLIFNRSLLDGYFEDTYDFPETGHPDWRLIIDIIAHIINNVPEEKEAFCR
jgi:hypothetical protein